MILLALLTPLAVAAIEKSTGQRAFLEEVSVRWPDWKEIPAGARLTAVRLGKADAPIAVYLHPRRGRWLLGSRFLGVIEDALVFQGEGQLDRALFHDARPGSVIEGLDSFGDGLATPPQRLRFHVARWGAFPHAVPREAADALLAAAPDVETAILYAISAEARGPRQWYVVNRR